MAISRIEIQNFLAFQGDFAADFCPGVNVLIGGNGTGKTTLLKVLYWASHVAKVGTDQPPPSTERFLVISDYFAGIRDSNLPGGLGTGQMIFEYRPSNTVDAENVLEINIRGTAAHDSDETAKYAMSEFTLSYRGKADCIFIPTTEMLSHARGLLAWYLERQSIPFDKTEVDIVAKAELEPTSEITPNAARTLEKLSAIIGHEVVFDGKDFYINRGAPVGNVLFSFEASGFRKLGLLWKLLRNGLLEPGSVLFWDEPENSLNPEHISALVDVLLELSRNGVQIFLATHSELLASYVAVNRKKSDEALFTSLYKEGDTIKATSDTRFDLLEPNNLTDVPVELYKKELERGLGGGD